MFGQTDELFIVLLIGLLLYGARKLPDLARDMNETAKEVDGDIADSAHDGIDQA